MNFQSSQTLTNHRTLSLFAIYSSNSCDPRYFTAHPIKSRPSRKCFFSNHNCVWVLCLTRTWCVKLRTICLSTIEVCSAGYILVYLEMTRTRVNHVPENMKTSTKFCHNLLMKCGHWCDKCTPNTTHCMYVYTHVCTTYIRMYMCNVHIISACVCTYVFIYIYIYIYVCVCLCTYVYVKWMFKMVSPFKEITLNYYNELMSSMAIRPIQRHKCFNFDVFIYAETCHGYEK